jgi:hypothetical protein
MMHSCVEQQGLGCGGLQCWEVVQPADKGMHINRCVCGLLLGYAYSICTEQDRWLV